MCRTGGRRCPGCNGETARAAHNARRRRNREIKREIVEEAQRRGAATDELDALRAGAPDAAKRWAAEHGLPEHFHPGRGHTAERVDAVEAAQEPAATPAAPAAPPALPPAPVRGGRRGGGGRHARGGHPAPTPAPRPQEAEWSSPRLDAQIATVLSRQGGHRDERNLLAGKEERIVDPDSLGTNETRRVQLDNGVVGYHKPLSGLNHELAREFGHRDETGGQDAQQPIHEVAAWQVARELGPPWDGLVPPVVMREFNGQMGSFALERPGAQMRKPDEIDRDEAMAGAFFDCLIGQQDRHPNNYLVQGDRLTLIDHGYSFARDGDYLNWSFLQMGRFHGDERDRRLSGAEITALDKLLDSKDTLGLDGVLTADRVAAVRSRAEKMRLLGEILPAGTY